MKVCLQNYENNYEKLGFTVKSAEMNLWQDQPQINFSKYLL